MNCQIRDVGFAAVLADGSLSTNHTTQLKYVTSEKVFKVAHQNLDDLEKLLELLLLGPLRLFRIGSSFVPFASHEAFPQPWQPELATRLRLIGDRYVPLGFRFSMHPGQYITLSSPSSEVRARSVAELEYSVDVLDLMGLDSSHKVVLHGGGLYGDREETTQRLIRRARELPQKIRNRLVLENDERFYNLEQILDISEEAGLPVIFDIHHHRINPGEIALESLLRRVRATWDCRPKIHISSQREGARVGAHSDLILEEDLEILCGLLPFEADLMVEAKSKEVAALEVWGWLHPSGQV